MKIKYGRLTFHDIAITSTRLQGSENVNLRLYQVFKVNVLERNNPEPDKRKSNSFD